MRFLVVNRVIKENKRQIKKTGTLQDWIINPLLGNIPLDGIEMIFGAENSKGNYFFLAWRNSKNKGFSLIRYSDDFLVTVPSREQTLEKFLPPLY